MSEYDHSTGKLRPLWTVRFSPWITLLGALFGGCVAGGVLDFVIITGSGSGNLNSGREVAEGAIQILGASIVVFAVLGPLLGWGLAFALRNVANQGLHVLAFAALGLFVGFEIGNIIGARAGIVGLGAAVAPACGIGAAVGRWAISRFARA